MPVKSFVVRSSQDGWMVQREGKKSPESTHKKKDVAVRRGRSLARGRSTHSGRCTKCSLLGNPGCGVFVGCIPCTVRPRQIVFRG